MEDEQRLNVEAAAAAPAAEVDSVEEEEEEQQLQLVPKRNAVSIVWQYFGFKREDTAQKTVKCKLCGNTVVTLCQGNTSSLFHHLQTGIMLQHTSACLRNRSHQHPVQVRCTTFTLFYLLIRTS